MSTTRYTHFRRGVVVFHLPSCLTLSETRRHIKFLSFSFGETVIESTSMMTIERRKECVVQPLFIPSKRLRLKLERIVRIASKVLLRLHPHLSPWCVWGLGSVIEEKQLRKWWSFSLGRKKHYREMRESYGNMEQEKEDGQWLSTSQIYLSPFQLSAVTDWCPQGFGCSLLRFISCCGRKNEKDLYREKCVEENFGMFPFLY